MSDDLLFTVCLTSDQTSVDILEELFFEAGFNMTSWEEADTGEVLFQEYFESEDEAVQRLSEVDSLVSGIDAEVHYDLALKRVESRDWTEYWKRFFHTAKVSARTVIKPSWEQYVPETGELVIEIDPGMSFGTGLHPTTRMCISLLDDMSGSYCGNSMADLGCGSGILSIAATKMGYNPVIGIDNDPLAVEIANANAKLNSVQICFSVNDMQSLRVNEQYDVVVINMLASLLARFAEDAIRLLKPGAESRLIISGMLKDQFDETIEIYRSIGLRVLETREQDGWKSAVCCLT